MSTDNNPIGQCAVCRRPAGAVWHRDEAGVARAFCSLMHFDLFLHRGYPLNADEREGKAVIAGGEAAGGYLETIGKSDLASLTAEEWDHFCALFWETACGRLGELLDAEPPF